MNQLRTDVFVNPGSGDAEVWELREFHLTRGPLALVGQLRPATLAQTPDQHSGSASIPSTPQGPTPFAPELAAWITANISSTASSAVLPRYTIPTRTPCPLGASLPCNQPFLGGAADNQLDFWSVPGPANPAQNVLSVNTRNGCHGLETGTNFLQMGLFGGQTSLSGFLTRTTVQDPRIFSISHTYNDLFRRKRALQTLASGFCGVSLAVPLDLQDRVFPSPLPPIEFVPVLATH